MVKIRLPKHWRAPEKFQLQFPTVGLNGAHIIMVHLNIYECFQFDSIRFDLGCRRGRRRERPKVVMYYIWWYFIRKWTRDLPKLKPRKTIRELSSQDFFGCRCFSYSCFFYRCCKSIKREGIAKPFAEKKRQSMVE